MTSNIFRNRLKGKLLTSPEITGGTIDNSPIGSTTASTVRALLDEDIEASSGALTANQCAGGLLGNQGQTTDVTKTLPPCAAGMSLRWVAGTTVAKFYRFDPDANDKIYLDGLPGADGKYVGVSTVGVGDSITIEAVKTGASEWNWNATSGLGVWALEA